MPVDRTQGGPAASRRRLVAGMLLGMVMGTAACGSGAASSSGGATAATAPPLAPFLGTLTTVTLPAGIQSLRGVACPSADRCWAVGTTLGSARAPASAAVLTTTTGGASWRAQAIPPTVGYLAGIACPTTRTCTAVGQLGTDGAGPGAVLTTTDSGATWVLQSLPAGSTDVTAVDCLPAGPCSALADVAGRVTALAPGAPGAPWVARGALPATVASATALACTDARHCWTTVLSPVDVGHVTGSVAGTADGGATWALQSVPSGTGALEGIDCTRPAVPATSTTSAAAARVDCTAVGTTATGTGATRSGRGLVLTTADGGTTWTPAPVTATSAALLAVSCGAGPCAAVGTTVAGAPQAGVVVLAGSSGASPSAWAHAAVAGIPLPLAGVSCRSLSTCVMVGESVSARLGAG